MTIAKNLNRLFLFSGSGKNFLDALGLRSKRRPLDDHHLGIVNQSALGKIWFEIRNEELQRNVHISALARQHIVIVGSFGVIAVDLFLRVCAVRLCTNSFASASHIL